MDPFTAVGLVAAVGQLAGSAITIYFNLSEFYEAVKDAPKQSRELRKEIGVLYEILNDLKEVADRPKFKPSRSLGHTILEFDSLLNDMESRVKATKTGGVKRFKWPFSKDKTEQLLSKITRYKETIILTLARENV
jgi:hypothetical protein